MATDSAYAELGLAPGATETEVKAAWRRLVSQWHPDRNAQAGAVGRMQRINLAFEALRRAGFPGAVAATAPTADWPRRPSPAAAKPAAGPEAKPDAGPDAKRKSGPEPEAEPEPDGPAPPRPGAAPGRSVQRKVKLSLEEAALGCTKVLRGKASRVCAGCTGTGWQQPGPACETCAGAGTQHQRGWYGLFGSSLVACAACAGTGLQRQACATCAGTGQHETPGYRVTVRLPPGVRHGDQLQVDARRMRPDQSPGDLLIRVAVLPHAFFTFDGDGNNGRLHCTLPVNGFAWAAGRGVMVPTLTGLQSLALQRDVLVYTLPGQGFPVARRGPRGDQIITVQPIFPDRLSTDQQILLDQLVAATSGAGSSAAGHPLRAWQQTVLAWQRGLGGHGG